jgi:hypothetical protein
MNLPNISRLPKLFQKTLFFGLPSLLVAQIVNFTNTPAGMAQEVQSPTQFADRTAICPQEMDGNYGVTFFPNGGYEAEQPSVISELNQEIDAQVFERLRTGDVIPTNYTELDPIKASAEAERFIDMIFSSTLSDVSDTYRYSYIVLRLLESGLIENNKIFPFTVESLKSKLQNTVDEVAIQAEENKLVLTHYQYDECTSLIPADEIIREINKPILTVTEKRSLVKFLEIFERRYKNNLDSLSSPLLLNQNYVEIIHEYAKQYYEILKASQRHLTIEQRNDLNKMQEKLNRVFHVIAYQVRPKLAERRNRMLDNVIRNVGSGYREIYGDEIPSTYIQSYRLENKTPEENQGVYSFRTLAENVQPGDGVTLGGVFVLNEQDSISGIHDRKSEFSIEVQF